MSQDEESGDVAWADPDHPPVEAIDCGGGVWVSWATTFNEGDHPLIWHWCTQEKWRDRGAPYARSQWAPAGGKGHDLIARDPIHLEPSLYWPDCCGKHGFLRDGRWLEV